MTGSWTGWKLVVVVLLAAFLVSSTSAAGAPPPAVHAFAVGPTELPHDGDPIEVVCGLLVPTRGAVFSVSALSGALRSQVYGNARLQSRRLPGAVIVSSSEEKTFRMVVEPNLVSPGSFSLQLTLHYADRLGNHGSVMYWNETVHVRPKDWIMPDNEPLTDAQDYIIASSAHCSSDSSEDNTVNRPLLLVHKALVPARPYAADSPFIVEYRVWNAGCAPASRVELVDDFASADFFVESAEAFGGLATVPSHSASDKYGQIRVEASWTEPLEPQAAFMAEVQVHPARRGTIRLHRGTVHYSDVDGNPYRVQTTQPSELNIVGSHAEL